MQSEPGETCILTKTHPKKKKNQIMFLHITAKANNLEGWKILSYDGIDQKNLNEGESGSFSCS